MSGFGLWLAAGAGLLAPAGGVRMSVYLRSLAGDDE